VTPEHTTVYTLKAWRSPEHEVELETELTVTVPEPALGARELRMPGEAKFKRETREMNEAWKKFQEAVDKAKSSEPNYPTYDDLINSKGERKR